VPLFYWIPKRKSLFFERITTLLHPITYRHITGDGVNEKSKEMGK
jgi:hypothetical protein